MISRGSFLPTGAILEEDVRQAKARIKPGDMIRVVTDTKNLVTKVRKTYPFMVETDDGCFTWAWVVKGSRFKEEEEK